MLPATLEEQASALHAWERARKLRRASDLLRGLLGYVLSVSSFRKEGAWAVLLGLASLSDNGWRKRLRQESRLVRLVTSLFCGGPKRPSEQGGRPCALGGCQLCAP
jgi:hypothetical protein